MFNAEMKKRDREIQTWRKVLLNQGYSTIGAESAAGRIVSMDSGLKEKYIQWLESGVLPAIEIEGFDLVGLMDSLGMTETAAFLALDWLLREPEQAKFSLAEPVDRVIISKEAIEAVDKAETMDVDKEQRE